MSTTEPLDSITGAVLVGTWFSSLLYMAEMMQALFFFRHFRYDDWRLRTFVAVAFSVDTLSFLGNYAGVYLYLIIHAGDNVYVVRQNWAIPLHTISTGVVAIMVQGFLILRYWRFSRNTAFAFILSLAGLATAPRLAKSLLTSVAMFPFTFGSALTTCLMVVLYPALQDRTRVLVPGTVYLITQVSTDLLITAALISQLRKFNFDSATPGTQGRSVNRLVVLTLQTGSATTAIALSALIVFLTNDANNIPMAIMYSLGRVYMLSMLLNLNIRYTGEPSDTTRTSRGTSTGMRSHGGNGTLNRPRTANCTEEHNGIHVHRVVDIESRLLADLHVKNEVHLSNNRELSLPARTFRSSDIQFAKGSS